MQKKLAVIAASLFTLAMLLGPIGCANSRHHVFVFGGHVPSKAEKQGKEPSPKTYVYNQDEFIAFLW